MTTRLVKTEGEWMEIAGPWDDLLNTVSGATAFQSHQFLSCWWRHFGRDKELRIVAAFRDGRLIGVAPLHVAKRWVFGWRYRVLEFIGMPDELDRPKFLVADADEEIMDLLLDRICEIRDDWDIVQLDEMETASWQVSRLNAWANSTGLRFRVQALHPVPYLVKAGDWSGYLQCKSHRFEKRLRYADRRLRRDHDLTYRWSHGSDGSDAPLDAFFSIECNSWKASERLDVGVEPAYRAFYRDLLGNDSASLRGHVLVQYIDRAPSAATLAISSADTYHSLQIAHDKRYDRYSPGTLLEATEMQWFFENRTLRRYEFLGGSGPNKERWTNTSVDTSAVTLWRPGLHIAVADFFGFHVQLPGRNS